MRTLFTLSQVAEILNVRTPAARSMARRRQFKTIRVGKRVRVRPDDLEAYLARCPEAYAESTNEKVKGLTREVPENSRPGGAEAASESTKQGGGL